MSATDTIIWRTSGKVFLKRAVFGSVIMAGMINGFGLFSGLMSFDIASLLASLASIVISAAFYMLVFDEWQNWNRRRNEEWRLSKFTLGFRDTGLSIEYDDLQLVDIKSVSLSFWLGVRVRMTDGRAFMMSYLPNPKQVQAEIEQRATALQSEASR
ncbi:MAG: hypothetical protein ABJN34_07785 [Litoreibacter sp.]|uniref:hypothetical protein n=1 Tax=Litoreibacter sp. TaxID=1969459 RepID=UPI0032973BEA